MNECVDYERNTRYSHTGYLISMDGTLLNPNHDGWGGGAISLAFLLVMKFFRLQIKCSDSFVNIFFCLLCFPIVLSAYKFVFCHWQKFTLIMTGRGRFAPEQKCSYLKMQSCTIVLIIKIKRKIKIISIL